MAKSQWAADVSGMVKTYVKFLREGVTCVCGTRVPQPLLSGAAPSITPAAAAPVVIDLTEDDE
jgi:hypothetical protein